MEVLVLDGKNYVKASKAAKDLGYATDYVGQLCRSAQVDAHLIGRTWYVNQEMLSTHKVEKKRMSRVKAREYAKKSIEEHRLKVKEEKNIYKNIDIQYEHDGKELIPKTKKLIVKSNTTPASRDVYSDDQGDEMEVVNEGDKVLMSGSINVVDVTDGPADDGTVFLTPGRIRKTPKKAIPEEVTVDSLVTEETDIPVETLSSSQPLSAEMKPIEGEEDTVAPEQRKIPSFIERLEQKEAIPQTDSEVATENTIEPIKTPLTRHENLVKRIPAMPIGVLLTILILTLLSTTISTEITFTAEAPGQLHSRLLFSTSEVISLITRIAE